MGRYLGVDLHRNCFNVCTLAENGRHYHRRWSIKELDKFAASLRDDDAVAVEVTTNTELFCNAVRPCVKKLAVVNPRQFKVISQSVKKTDRHDAEMLAEFLSKDMLPEVRMKNEAQARVASLTKTRDMLVKQRTALKNKINNILAAYGVLLPKESLSSKRRLLDVPKYALNASTEVELRVLSEQILSLNESVAKLEKLISEDGSKLKGHKNLKSIKGIGDVGASVLSSIIGDVNDFDNEGKLASYFGIVPRVYNTNEKEHHGRITKRGSKLGRTTLVQCALVAKRYSLYLGRYYERIKKRRGSGKAIIALARKFLTIIYRTLKNDWIFLDFPNFIIAEPAA